MLSGQYLAVHPKKINNGDGAYVREVGIYTGEYFALPGKFDVHMCRVGYV